MTGRMLLNVTFSHQTLSTIALEWKYLVAKQHAILIYHLWLTLGILQLVWLHLMLVSCLLDTHHLLLLLLILLIWSWLHLHHLLLVHLLCLAAVWILRRKSLILHILWSEKSRIQLRIINSLEQGVNNLQERSTNLLWSIFASSYLIIWLAL